MCEDVFAIFHDARDALLRREIREVPNVLADHEVRPVKTVMNVLQQLAWIFFAEHHRWRGVKACDGIGFVFADDVGLLEMRVPRAGFIDDLRL